MFEKNYELVKFHANWADELDINSFSIKPEGYLKELAEKYKSKIPDKVYIALCEIDIK